MDRHARIDVFSLAAHRLAVQRLRERPQRLTEALGVIHRWRQEAGRPQRGDVYWDEWEHLLNEGVDAVERVALARTDHAATLRSMSPLGRFITVEERSALLRQASEAA